MATEPHALLSYEDYAAIDDDERYEVLEGVLTPMGPAPFLRHQRIAAQIWRVLDDYERAQRLGRAYMAPADVVLQAARPATVLQPDVMFVRDRTKITQANVQGPPDLVVEVLSPSNARKDAIRKRALYERFGVAEFWIVPLHEDRIEVMRLGPDGKYGAPLLFQLGDRLTSPNLPGFELDVATIFPDDD
jgi:Uma2 family endonuclease